jgi:hypothetical protein
VNDNSKEVIVNQYQIPTLTTLDWSKVPSLTIEQYPWYQSGLKQSTTMQLAIVGDALYWKANAQDCHSFAQVTELNGPVYMDSCVEFFLSPRNQLGSAYLNFEVNCCGTLHLAYGPGRENRTLCTLEQAAQIEITTSLKSRVKMESQEDQQWTTELKIPLKLIEEITGEPLDLSTWYANFYRCGGRIEDQYASWNPIQTENPDFHRPEFFGALTF